jgi:hypothetical protein
MHSVAGDGIPTNIQASLLCVRPLPFVSNSPSGTGKSLCNVTIGRGKSKVPSTTTIGSTLIQWHELLALYSTLPGFLEKCLMQDRARNHQRRVYARQRQDAFMKVRHFHNGPQVRPRISLSHALAGRPCLREC